MMTIRNRTYVETIKKNIEEHYRRFVSGKEPDGCDGRVFVSLGNSENYVDWDIQNGILEVKYGKNAIHLENIISPSDVNNAILLALNEQR